MSCAPMTQNAPVTQTPLPPRSRVFSHQTHEDIAEEVWNDRDLSWLEFNRRVLHEALDARTPLLERVKFLAIFTSNLDEFFMKRVGAMRTRAFASGSAADVDAFNKHMSVMRQVIVPMLETRSSAALEL